VQRSCLKKFSRRVWRLKTSIGARLGRVSSQDFACCLLLARSKNARLRAPSMAVYIPDREQTEGRMRKATSVASATTTSRTMTTGAASSVYAPPMGAILVRHRRRTQPTDWLPWFLWCARSRSQRSTGRESGVWTRSHGAAACRILLGEGKLLGPDSASRWQRSLQQQGPGLLGVFICWAFLPLP